MKYMLSLIILAAFAVSFTSKKSVSQQNNEFLMCIVHGNYDQKTGFELATEFKNTYAVQMCRLDHVSKKFFIVFESGKVIRQNVIDFFAAKNMKATCAVIGKHGVDSVPDLNATECK